MEDAAIPGVTAAAAKKSQFSKRKKSPENASASPNSQGPSPKHTKKSTSENGAGLQPTSAVQTVLPDTSSSKTPDQPEPASAAMELDDAPVSARNY